MNKNQRSLLGVLLILFATLGTLGACGAHQGDNSRQLSTSPGVDSLANHPEGEDWDDVTIDYDKEYSSYVASAREEFEAFHPKVPVPDVKRIRFVDRFSWPQAQIDCLAAAGFHAEEKQGGLTFPEVPEGQEQAFAIAGYTCELQYPMDPRYTSTLPRKAAEAQYERFVQEVKPCIEKLGYSVEEPPSKITWLESYYSGVGAWSPMIRLEEESVEQDKDLNPDVDLDVVYEKCPLYSPDIYTFDK